MAVARALERQAEAALGVHARSRELDQHTISAHKARLWSKRLRGLRLQEDVILAVPPPG